jgi:pimeloyl-ACP methyl ester carboxylesterase
MQGAGTIQSLAIDGYEFFYFDEGEARAGTILVLHGFPDTPHSFEPLATAFANQGYRVLRPFLPGYSPSRWRGPFDVSNVSSRILKFLESVEAGPVHLLGHDWGALLSYAMLYERPECFVGSATMSVPHPLHLMRRGPSLEQLLRSAYILFFQLPWLPEAWLDSRRRQLVATLWKRWSPDLRLPAATVADIESCLRDSSSAPFAYYRNLVLRFRQNLACFGEIEVPLFYVHGANDGCIGQAMAEGQEHYFTAGYETRTLSGVGHFLQLEAPAELAQLLGRWFHSHRC